MELRYLLRVYDESHHFDETAPQPLWIVDQVAPDLADADVETELRAGYGESRLALQTISLQGGTVRATGRDIPPGHTVWLAGHNVPVDPDGAFVAEQILV